MEKTVSILASLLVNQSHEDIRPGIFGPCLVALTIAPEPEAMVSSPRTAADLPRFC